MPFLKDLPKEILHKIIEIVALEKENDLIREIITLDEHYKQNNTVLASYWHPCSSRYKARQVYIRDNSLISRLFPIPKLPQEKKKILFMIQIMNTQANYIIGKKLFKSELCIIKCMYNIILYRYGFHESDFEKVAKIVSPDFKDRLRQYEQEELNKKQDEIEIYEQYQKQEEEIRKQKEKDKKISREIWRNTHRLKKEINLRYIHHKIARAYSLWVKLVR